MRAMRSLKPIYKIGLVGGIASGKSTLLRYLEGVAGISTLQLDHLAHNLYEKSPLLRQQIAQTFGEECLTPDKKNVNRPALGKIVFYDQAKLTSLNQIIWPQLEFYMDFILEQYENQRLNFDVVVVEGAVILQADWDDKFNELWGTTVSDLEEIKRRIRERKAQTMSDEAIQNLVKMQQKYNKDIEERCSFWYDTTSAKFEGENEMKVIQKLRRLRDQELLRLT